MDMVYYISSGMEPCTSIQSSTDTGFSRGGAASLAVAKAHAVLASSCALESAMRRLDALANVVKSSGFC